MCTSRGTGPKGSSLALGPGSENGAYSESGAPFQPSGQPACFIPLRVQALQGATQTTSWIENAESAFAARSPSSPIECLLPGEVSAECPLAHSSGAAM